MGFRCAFFAIFGIHMSVKAHLIGIHLNLFDKPLYAMLTPVLSYIWSI